MWRQACVTLVAPGSDEAWKQIVDASPSDTLWHSLRNCVAYQAGVWQNLLAKGVDDVMQPAAFKLAIVLRHTPTELAVRLLAELLHQHPQSQDLTSYVLALLTDDEAQWCGSCACGAVTAGMGGGAAALAAAARARAASPASSDRDSPDCTVDSTTPAIGELTPPSVTPTPTPPTPPTPPGPAPLRDLQLFGDCELAVMGASREEYEAHAKLVRAEYSTLSAKNYVELRIKVLNQLSQIPKLFHTYEFECFETTARENIEREINTLREHLLTGRRD